MQNAMTTNTSGKIKAVNVCPGDTVADEDILIELE